MLHAPPSLGVEALLARLDRDAVPNAVIAFDGDGTLWSGDVGEDVFAHFVSHEWLRAVALEPLCALAERFGIQHAASSASSVADAIFAAYRAGSFPEREVCEMMTWCYAGWPEHEFRRQVEDLLASLNFAQRKHAELNSIFDWVRRRDVRVVVISASPQIVVESAAAYWGIDAVHVAASRAAHHEGYIAPELELPTPYADHKPVAGRRLFGDAAWLASFGDNVFDLDMLRAARHAVLVRPKPALLERWHEVPGCSLLA